VTFVSDLPGAVAAAKERGDGTYVNVLGADVGRQCLQAGLLDEVLVFFAPVLFGVGTQMFASTNGHRIDLEPATDDASTGTACAADPPGVRRLTPETRRIGCTHIHGYGR
jgi:dihydrofolate reductase